MVDDMSKIHYFSGIHGALTKTWCGRYYSEDVNTWHNEKDINCKLCLRILEKIKQELKERK